MISEQGKYKVHVYSFIISARCFPLVKIQMHFNHYNKSLHMNPPKRQHIGHQLHRIYHDCVRLTNNTNNGDVTNVQLDLFIQAEL